ncbi:hypothetical protein Tco_1011504, partial [Tanacetum coccineum]
MMGEVDIKTLTIEQYLMLTQRNQASGMVKPKFGMKEKDIEDMTIAEYMEHESKMKRQSWRNVRPYFLTKHEDTDINSIHHNKRKILDYPHHSYDSKTNVYYDLPPLLPCFKHVQLHTIYRHELLEEDTDYVSKDESETKMERHMCGHDKEGEEDALIAILKSLVGECKAVYANKGEQIETSSNKTNEVQGVSFKEDDIQNEEGGILGALPCQLPPKELNPGSFTLPYTIGSLNLYVMADLGASVIIMPRLIFEHLRLANLKETDMLVVRADMTEKALLGIVENVLIDVFREISLGFREDRVLFDMDGNVCHSNILVEKVYMTNSIQNKEPFNPLEIGEDLFSYESPSCLQFEQHTRFCDDESIDTVDSSNDMQEPEVEHKEVDNLEKITSRWHVSKMGEVDINILTMKQYLELTRGNQAPGMVKQEIRGNVNFEIKSQFMRELREDTFSGNKNDDAHDYKEIGGKTTSRNNQYLGFAQAGFHSKKVNIFYKGLDTKNCQLLDSKGPIPNKTPSEALEVIQTMGNHSQNWHNGSNIRRVSNGSLDGIATVANKLDSLGRNMKKLKENVHVIQVGCETFRGSHLDKECPLREDVKSINEVKYGGFGRSFPNNNENSARYRVSPPRYYTRMDNQPLSGKRKLSLTEFITKYMEESAKKEAEHNEWLRKFQESTKMIKKKIEEVEEIKEAVAHHGLTPRKVIPSELSIVSYYVAPYEPSIPLARLLEQHAEEALVHKTMESLKESRTLENEDVKMSTGCLAILQNELPLMKQDPISFIIPYFIGILTFNALANLGASVSIMPLSMFKRLVDFLILDMVEDLRIPEILGKSLLATAHAKIDVHMKLISLDLGNQKVVFKTKNNPNKTLIESVCAIRNEKSITDDDLMKIDHELFIYNSESCDFLDNTEKCYWGCLNDDKRLDVAWEGMTFEDWVRVSHGKEENTKTEEDCEDLERFGEKKIELILDAVLDKLDDDWFTGIINDEDSLDRMVVYMELKAHDDFIDINDEAYKERMCKLLGMTYKKPSPILVEKV